MINMREEEGPHDQHEREINMREGPHDQHERGVDMINMRERST